MIGLSASRCIASICRGEMKLEDVEKIISGTAIKDERSFANVISTYRSLEWSDFPDKAEKMFRLS